LFSQPGDRGRGHAGSAEDLGAGRAHVAIVAVRRATPALGFRSGLPESAAERAEGDHRVGRAE
jgi:hypothetical protein